VLTDVSSRIRSPSACSQAEGRRFESGIPLDTSSAILPFDRLHRPRSSGQYYMDVGWRRMRRSSWSAVSPHCPTPPIRRLHPHQQTPAGQVSDRLQVSRLSDKVSDQLTCPATVLRSIPVGRETSLAIHRRNRADLRLA